jgi:UDP-glucose 4-epimerase
MRVLVVGGFGFLGGRAAQHLAARGHSVILGSRLASAPPPDWLPEAATVRADLADAASLRAACRSVDAVVHAAGTNAADSARDPALAATVNDEGTRNLVLACRESVVTRLVYLSTAHVYCSPLTGHLDERSPLLNSHPYAATHARGEVHVGEFNDAARVGIVLRLSNIYGAPTNPGVSCWHLLVNDLCRQAAVGRELRLTSSGGARRDFLPMPDFLTALERFLRGPAPNDRTFNVGRGEPQSVADMASTVAAYAERLGWGPFEIRTGNTSDASSEFVFDVSRARAAGWTAEGDDGSAITDLLTACARWRAPQPEPQLP